jgi:hypothetical protein
MAAFVAARARCAAPRATPAARTAQPVRCNILLGSAPLARAPRAPAARLGAARSTAAAAAAARGARARAAASSAGGDTSGAPEGSGVEDTWSPVASQDPLFDTADELVQVDASRAPAGVKGRNIMARRARFALACE